MPSSPICRARSWKPNPGIADEGFVPLASFLDAGGPDAIAATIEANAEGAVYPVLYLRRDGRAEERVLPSHPMNDFATAEHRRALAAVLAEAGVGVAVG